MRGRVLSSLDDHQRLAEFDRLTVLEQNLNHGTASRSWNLVHGFHRLHDQQRIAGLDLAADIDEWLAARFGRCVSRSDHWRDHHPGVFRGIDRLDGSLRSRLRRDLNPHCRRRRREGACRARRSEEHTSELQSRGHLVCRLLLEKKKKKKNNNVRKKKKKKKNSQKKKKIKT